MLNKNFLLNSTMEINNNNNNENSNADRIKNDSNRETNYFKDQRQRGELTSNREFTRRLVNDYIHYKIYGKSKTDPKDSYCILEAPDETTLDTKNMTKKIKNGEYKRFSKTSKTLRKVSIDLEQSNSDFFDNVCNNLKLKPTNAEKAFQIVSEEVLSVDSLNWGRVVSLFTFGGKLAEWFWATQKNNKDEKIEEIEEWLTESLSGKEAWIEENGGWDNFNDTFAPEETLPWLKSGIAVCVGVSLAALFAFRK